MGTTSTIMDGGQGHTGIRRATSYDVARHAGVSQSAVSRCFRDGGSVSPDTRAKVLQAARALGYAPSRIARSLVTQRSRMVAVLVSERTTETHPTLLVRLGLEIQAADRGMLAFITPGDDAGPALADILGHHADAVISAVSVPDTVMRACAGHRIPVVTYNRAVRDPWASCVGCDDGAAMDRLAAHLRAGGTRRVHLVAGPDGAPASASRLAAARDAAAMHGLVVTGTTHGDYSYGSGRAAAPAIMAHTQTPDAPRPDAVVCVNDAMAMGVIDACRHDLGLRVPDDVAVSGYDDTPEAAHASYGLTTLSQPTVALARAAVRMARDRLDDLVPPGERSLLPVSLAVRTSTRPATPDRPTGEAA